MKQQVYKKIGEVFLELYKRSIINRKNVVIKVANKINKIICQQLYNENNDFIMHIKY